MPNRASRNKAKWSNLTIFKKNSSLFPQICVNWIHYNNVNRKTLYYTCLFHITRCRSFDSRTVSKCSCGVNVYNVEQSSFLLPRICKKNLNINYLDQDAKIVFPLGKGPDFIRRGQYGHLVLIWFVNNEIRIRY